MATKNKALHYDTQADVRAAQEYKDRYGTLVGFESPSGNYDWENWSRMPGASNFAGSDGIFQPDEEQALLDASWGVWGGKPKEVSNLTKAGQGVVRVAKIIPGPHQAALNVLDQMSGNKLSGHEISKNPFVRALAGAAGGAAGSALGTSQSTSMGNAMKSGARMEFQDAMGMQPYARQGMKQIKDGWRPYRKPEASLNSITEGEHDWMNDGVKRNAEKYSLEGLGDYQGDLDPATNKYSLEDLNEKGGAGQWMDFDYGNLKDPYDNLPDIPGLDDARMSTIGGRPGSTAGAGVRNPGGASSVNPGGTATGGGAGGVGSGDGNNLFALAALGLLGESLKKDNKANIAPMTSSPYGSGMPTYGDLGLITNAQVVEDQRRRLAARKAA